MEGDHSFVIHRGQPGADTGQRDWPRLEPVVRRAEPGEQLAAAAGTILRKDRLQLILDGAVGGGSANAQRGERGPFARALDFGRHPATAISVQAAAFDMGLQVIITGPPLRPACGC